MRVFDAKYLKVQLRSRRALGSARVGKVRTRYPDKFTTNYESNKTVLADLVDAKTKRLRNRVVGYVTRLKIVEIRRAAAPTQISEESDRE